MLVLARKLNQQIVIGDNIYVKVVRMDKDVIKLGIQAPASIPVHRQEVYDEIQKSNRAALISGPRNVPKLSEDNPPSEAAEKPAA
jgi:carbon storage regulator